VRRPVAPAVLTLVVAATSSVWYAALCCVLKCENNEVRHDDKVMVVPCVVAHPRLGDDVSANVLALLCHPLKRLPWDLVAITDRSCRNVSRFTFHVAKQQTQDIRTMPV
jgi:hypothetical protein